MTNETIRSWVSSTAYAVAAVALMLAILIIAAEEIVPLKDWLKETFYHHWLGKGALALLLFAAAATALRYRRDTASLSTLVLLETVVVAFAAATIAGFFLLHTLKIV